MRNLILEKPICFFDLETTGVNPVTDKIVSISILKVYPDSEVEQLMHFVNPGIPIPPEVSAIHGLTNEMLAGDPSFKEISSEVLKFFKNSDIAGFNSNTFDIPLLSAEFARIEISFPDPAAKWIDVGNMYKKLKPRTLAAAYKEYMGRDHEGAHDAQSDNVATLHIFKRMLDIHEDLPLTVGELALYSDYNPGRVDIAGKFKSENNGLFTYTFGKHKGEIIGVSNVSFLGWMLKNDFHPDTKAWARRIYDSIIPPNAPARLK